MGRSDSLTTAESPRVTRYGVAVCVQVIANFIELCFDRLKFPNIDFRMVSSIFDQAAAEHFHIPIGDFDAAVP
jgi:hypothetical protein